MVSSAFHSSFAALVRDVQDELYLQYLTESCHDVVTRLLGPRRALLWSRETKLLSELLYYALTTGGGLQTLGEEYCDVLQAAGVAGGQPGAVRRGALVLLQSLGPYLAEKAAAPRDDEFAAWRAARLTAADPSAAAPPPGASGAAAPLRRRAADAAAHLRGGLRAAAAPLLRQWPAAAGFLRDNGPALLRLHLALFYLSGTYFQLSKRLAGVRYLFVARLLEKRPSYRFLGAALLLQLGAASALWALRRSGDLPLLRQLAPERQAAGKPRHAVLQREDGSEASAEEAMPASGGWAAAGEAEVPAGRRCPLCLSRRAFPTATPCGHVFCWRCVAEWCAQKPECPLCRAEVAPAALVRVCHADF